MLVTLAVFQLPIAWFELCGAVEHGIDFTDECVWLQMSVSK